MREASPNSSQTPVTLALTLCTLVSVHIAAGVYCTLYFALGVVFVAAVCPALLMCAQPLKKWFTFYMIS